MRPRKCFAGTWLIERDEIVEDHIIGVAVQSARASSWSTCSPVVRQWGILRYPAPIFERISTGGADTTNQAMPRPPLKVRRCVVNRPLPPALVSDAPVFFTASLYRRTRRGALIAESSISMPGHLGAGRLRLIMEGGLASSGRPD